MVFMVPPFFRKVSVEPLGAVSPFSELSFLFAYIESLGILPVHPRQSHRGYGRDAPSAIRLAT